MPRQYNFAFYVSGKSRTTEWGGHLAAGAKVHGDQVDLIPQAAFDAQQLKDYDGGGNIGLARAAKRLMTDYLAAGKHFLFFDKGYSGRGAYWRVSVDAWQPLKYFQRFMRPDDRLKAVGFRVQPQRRSAPDGTVLYAAACQNYCNFMDLGDVNDYNLEVLQKIRDHTDRVIVYRPNPSWYRKHYDEFRPIHEQVARVELSDEMIPYHTELERAHLVVTHGTGAAVAALAQGISSMVLGPGICRPISMTEENWNKVDRPFFPKSEDRYQLFSDMHYCQWTVDEYRSGQAWEELRWILAALEGGADTTSADLIKQYKVMHANPAYFRGLTTRHYTDQIGAFLAEHKVETLLDYGSGKGVQYEVPDVLARWRAQAGTGLKVTCYDPGVPKFSKLPKGVFDGVICCDVMEHVPERDVPATLRRILGYATKAVFFAIATSPAVKFLPDGRNCHVTVRPRAWWQARIQEAVRDGVGSNDAPCVELVTTAKDVGDECTAS